MMSSASASISWRTCTLGQPSPVTCSFSRSPEPIPSVNRSSEMIASVAAACAMIAGWYRTVGQVTPVARPSRSVRAAMALSTFHAYGEWPCSSSHGWKWSLISTKSNPACSAATACRISSLGPKPSAMSLYPKRMPRAFPANRPSNVAR